MSVIYFLNTSSYMYVHVGNSEFPFMTPFSHSHTTFNKLHSLPIFMTDNHYLHVKPPQSAIVSDFEWRTLRAN